MKRLLRAQFSKKPRVFGQTGTALRLGIFCKSGSWTPFFAYLCSPKPKSIPFIFPDRSLRPIIAFHKHLAQLVLLAMLAAMVNAVVNRHAHRLSDGRLIWHAHPYKPQPKETSSPVKSHGHSDHELLLLDLLTNPAYLPVFFGGWVILFWGLAVASHYPLPIPRAPRPARPATTPPRGPPARA